MRNSEHPRKLLAGPVINRRSLINEVESFLSTHCVAVLGELAIVEQRIDVPENNADRQWQPGLQRPKRGLCFFFARSLTCDKTVDGMSFTLKPLDRFQDMAHVSGSGREFYAGLTCQIEDIHREALQHSFARAA